MGDHFDKNEKNPPGGATVAKYSKQILKLIYLHYVLNHPQGCQGCQKNWKDLTITTMIRFAANF